LYASLQRFAGFRCADSWPGVPRARLDSVVRERVTREP